MISASLPSARVWSFYVLECQKRSYYAGVTTDVSNRERQHVRGKGSRYTRAHQPVRLIFAMTCPSKQIAMSIEARFKGLDRKKKEEFLQLKGDLWQFYRPLGLFCVTRRK